MKARFLSAAALCALLAPTLAFSPSALEAKVQAYAQEQSERTGFAIQMAYHSATDEFAVSAGTSKRGAVSKTDRFLFGSGTKPYTAAAVFQLADSGKLALDDPASTTIDLALRKLGSSATFASLFGVDAAKVTIGMLVRMQSGINDFDVPSFDNPLLTNASGVHSPLEFIQAAASLTPQFVCAPGNCTSYSSTNYILAGLVLLGSSDASSWTTVNQAAVLPASTHFPNSLFLTTGPINGSVGATVAGQSEGFSPSMVEIWGQDASILGWTCGNLAAPTEEVARFMYELLVSQTVVSAKAMAAMKAVVPLDVGWAKGTISYGAGLMIQQTSRHASFPPKLSEWGSYLGHGGDTYGFLSEQGLIPQLNATFSVIANEDYYLYGSYVKSGLACNLIEMAALEVLGEELDLGCLA